MDSSCSIDSGSHGPNWKKSVDFVSKLVDSLNVSDTGVHVGIIEFADKVTDNLQLSGSKTAV